MDMSIAESLGDKLATLELTEDEGKLLLSLMGADEAETQGFGWDEGVAAIVGGKLVVAKGFSFGVSHQIANNNAGNARG